MPKNNKPNKNLDLINNENLEQSIKLVNHLTDLVERLRSDFVGTSKTNKSTIISDGLKQSEELRANIKDIMRQLKSLGIDTGFKLDIGLPTQGDIDNLLEYGDLLEEQNKQYKEAIKLEAQRQAAIEAEKEKLAEKKKVLQEIDKLERKGKKDINEKREENKKLSLNNIGRRSKIDDDLNEAEKNLSNKTSELRARAEKGDLSLSDLDEEDILGGVGKDLKKGAEKFSIGSAAIQIGAETLKKGAEIFYDGVMAGLNNQVSAYNSSFSNIAVRTGLSAKDYRNAQNNLAGIFGQNQLGSQGLEDNVSTSEVQQMWNTLAENGVNQNTMFANAIDNIVTRKIVPYLDTSSVAWQQMVSIQPDLQKNIRGINKANQEIAGNNYATADLLDEIIYNMQPMADVAIKELAEGSTQVTAMINSLMKEGWSKEAATNQATKLFEQQYRGYDLLSNGSLEDSYNMVQLMTSGINIYDPKQFADTIGSNIKGSQYLANFAPGFNSTNNGVLSGAVANSLGMDTRLMMTYQNYGIKDIEGLVAKVKEGSEEVGEYGNEQTDLFTNGAFQTEEEKQTIYLENLSNDLATLKESLGKWWDVGKVLLEGIGAAVAGKLASTVIGKGIGKLAGSAAGGVGEGILASGGGVALGAVGAVAAAIIGTIAVVEAVKAVGNKIKADDEEQAVKAESLHVEDYNNNSAASSLAGITKDKAMTKDEYFWDAGQFTENIGGWWEAQGFLGIGGKDADAKKNQKAGNWIDYNVNQFLGKGLMIDSTSMNEKERLGLIAAYAIALDEQNMLNQGILGKIAGNNTYDLKTRQDIQDFIKGAQIKRSDILFGVNMIQESGVHPANKDGQYWVAEITPEEMKKYGYDSSKINDKSPENAENYRFWHRQGLDSVPFDNYPATLHEGEAILTASTANELRNLTDTYRETTQRQADMEAIIQSQTTSLCTKLDEVIHAIQISNNMQVAPVSDDPVSNNMRYIRSTKSFI